MHEKRKNCFASATKLVAIFRKTDTKKENTLPVTASRLLC
jgi:hypothetical protein